MKEKIPNALTIIRIVFTPVIMLLGFTKHFYSMVIIGLLVAFTDCLDGYLARKWKVVSQTGAKLDALADKIFSISLIGCLMGQQKILIIPFVLEILIGCTNLYYHFKNTKINSLMVGKIKTCSLFATVICGIIIIFYTPLTTIFYGFVYTTIHLQILSLIFYAIDFFYPKHKPSIEDNEMHQKIMNEKEEPVEFDQTMILENLEDLAKEYEYNNETDDVY